MVTLAKEDAKRIAAVAAICIVFGAILITFAIGREAAWLGAVVAIPGGLLAGAIYTVLRKRRLASSNQNESPTDANR